MGESRSASLPQPEQDLFSSGVSSDDLLVGQGGARVRVQGGDLHLAPDGVVHHRHMVRAVRDKYPIFRKLL